ncbi:MAG: DUF4160 domain-containing protein [Terracidiphilus sp.]|jgi:hypothetical protein
MPTVLRIGAMRVAIYPNDHRPAHVHVIGHGHEAVFILNDPVGVVVLRENYGFSSRDLVHIQGEIEENLAALSSAWEGIHGTR